MHIEMSFGWLVNKFRMFIAPLYCIIENAPRLFLAATHLHNYCIDEGEAVKEPGPTEPPPLPVAYYNEKRGNYFRVQSMIRQFLIKNIAQKGLWRPGTLSKKKFKNFSNPKPPSREICLRTVVFKHEDIVFNREDVCLQPLRHLSSRYLEYS